MRIFYPQTADYTMPVRVMLPFPAIVTVFEVMPPMEITTGTAEPCAPANPAKVNGRAGAIVGTLS